MNDHHTDKAPISSTPAERTQEDPILAAMGGPPAVVAEVSADDDLQRLGARLGRQPNADEIRATANELVRRAGGGS